MTGALGGHYQKEEWRESWRTYLGLVSLLDDCVGRILCELKDQGIYDDCLILFTSDHGEMLGSHRLFQKMCMYQESVKVPLYLRLPGSSVRHGRILEQNVSHIDVLPTLCHYLGLETGSETEGASLHDLIDGIGSVPSHPVFIQYDGNSCLSGFQRCVVDGNRKLIMDVFQKETFFELYDISADPQETVNLLFEHEHADEGTRLLSLLLEHMKRTADPLICSQDVYKQFMGRIGCRFP